MEEEKEEEEKEKEINLLIAFEGFIQSILKIHLDYIYIILESKMLRTN